MYLEYWGLRTFPFENAPDPDFFFLSKTHEEGLIRLIYAAKMRKGCAMLSGDIGCGKTTLTQVYVQELSDEQFDIGLVVNPRLEPLEFLQEVIYQFGWAHVPNTKVECLRLLNYRMLENMKTDRETLLIIDEAQVLSDSAFEEIRLLLNFQLNGRFLITVILVGQPELNEKIRNIEQLNQRIAIRHYIKPFDHDDTVEYINFRQKRAGREENAFTSEAVEKIYEITKGVPRMINHLCDVSLLIGFSMQARVIDQQIIEDIMKDGAIF